MGMEEQAAEKLGEAVSQVAIVSPRGHGKKMMTAGVARQLGGALGAAGAETLANRRLPGGPGDHKGFMVIALGATKIGFFKQKTGLLKPSCGDLLETFPRDQVTAFDIGGGALTSPVTMTFQDGTEFEFEAPRAQKGKAERFKAALGL